MTSQIRPEVGGVQNINNHTYFSEIDMTPCHFLGKHGHGIAEHAAMSSLVHLRSVADSFPTAVIPSHKLRLPSFYLFFQVCRTCLVAVVLGCWETVSGAETQTE